MVPKLDKNWWLPSIARASHDQFPGEGEKTVQSIFSKALIWGSPGDPEVNILLFNAGATAFIRGG